MRWILAPSDDRGIFSVLYVLLILTLFGTAALVVDISTLRESRRTTRSAADSAVLAGASQLNILDPTASSPRAACEKAWRYLADQLPGLRYSDRSGSCGVLPLTGAPCPVTASPAPAAVASGSYHVRVTWPVENAHRLMTAPDVAPVAAPTQSPDADFDGSNDDRCARIGVEVFRDNRFGLAAAFGITGAETRAASVARGVVEGDRQDIIAALNILERDRCSAIVTRGQGFLTVNGADGKAGVIAIESSGRDAGSRCPNNRRWVIDPAPNPLNFVHADGPTGVGTGVIYSYAMIGSTLGNPDDAFDPTLSPPTKTIINPRPVRLSERYGAKPVTDIFDCQIAVDGCSLASGSWMGQLKTAYAGTIAPTSSYEGAEAPYRSAAFQTLPNAALVPEFKCNTQPSDPTVVVPPGNWYIDCATLSVANTVIFQGGVIVTKGGIEAGSSSACIAVNVPSTTCPTTNSTAVPAATTIPAPTKDAILYVRSGRLYKVSQAQFYMPQTFTYLQDAGNSSYISLGGGSGSLLWTTPLGIDCANVTMYPTPVDQQRCRDRRFVRLVLWSESDENHEIGGQTGLELRGVLFTPNAEFTYDGQGTQNQTDAQFWTKLLVVQGQAGLTMVADPAASVARPSLGVSLIR